MIQKVYFVFLLTFLAIACNTDEPDLHFSDIPEISLKSVEFINSESNSGLDTVKIKLNFTDGDADLGFSLSTGYGDPYLPYIYYYWENGLLKETTDPNGVELIKINDIDTLPDFNCSSYIIDEGLDTIYVSYNRYHTNLWIDIFTTENNDLTYFEWPITDSKDRCLWRFDVRFPFPEPDKIVEYPPYFKIKPQNEYSGELEYNFIWGGFNYFFKDQEISIKIQIVDRALNSSNVIFTPPIKIE